MVYRDETMVAVAQGSRIQEMVVGNAKECMDRPLLYPTRCFFDVNFHRVTDRVCNCPEMEAERQ